MFYDSKTERNLAKRGREIMNSGSIWVQRKIKETAKLYSEILDDPNRIDRFICWSGLSSDLYATTEDEKDFGYMVPIDYDLEESSDDDWEEELELSARILAELIYHSQPHLYFSNGTSSRRATNEEAIESFLAGPEGLIETTDGIGWTE